MTRFSEASPRGCGRQRLGDDMRVLSVLHDGRLGGPQWRIAQVGAQLRRRGIETHVVFPYAGKEFPALLDRLGLAYDCLDLVRVRATRDPREHLRWVTGFAADVRRLRALIRRERIDVVHVNGLMNTQGCLAARRQGVPLVWHLNDETTPRPIVQALSRPLRSWPAVIVISAPALIPHYFPDGVPRSTELHVIYPPVDTARFDSRAVTAAPRRALGVPEDSLLLGTVANLNPTKGIDVLVRALASARKHDPRLHALVVGPRLSTRQAYAASLEELVQETGVADHITFLGQRLDVPEVLACVDLYIHPSRREGVGMAAMEASAMELPVVASATGGLTDVIESGRTGLLVEPGSVTELVAAIESLAADPTRMAEMGQRGRENIQQKFSLQSSAEAHVAVYERALREQKTSRHEGRNMPAMKTVLKRAVARNGRILSGPGAGLRLAGSDSVRLYLGLYEVELNGWLRRLTGPGTPTFDIGAQFGLDALMFAKLGCDPVLTVEADPALTSIIEGNIARNRLESTVRLRTAVVGDGTDGTVSIDELAREHFQPDFVKMDIEGAEVDALRGAGRTLTSCRKWLVETHGLECDNACLQTFSSLGYEIHVVEPRRWLPERRPISHNRWIIATR